MMGGAAGGSEPTILAGLHGRVRLTDTAALLVMPLAAAVVYGLVWPLRDSENVMNRVYWSLVTVQIISGAVVVTWAWRRAVGERRVAMEISTQISVK